MIILDTDVLIEILEKKATSRKKMLIQLLKREKQEVATTSLNLEEILYGILKRTSLRALPPHHPLLSFPIVPFTNEDALIAARLEVELERKGNKKPRGDILIAAIAIRTKSSLFTLNLKHFEDIPGLTLLKLPT